MERTDFNNKSNPLFDDPRFKCQTRKGGHASEIVAGDKATVTLKDDLRHVLKLVSQRDGQTAGKLGEDSTVYLYGGDTITEWNVADIKKQLNLPDKKMHKLVEHGYVRIEEVKGSDNRNWITDAGKAALK